MFDEFIKKYEGKPCEVGGSPNALNQCVDLANAYLIEVCGLPGIFNTNAIDFPSKAGANLDYIVNTPAGVPQKGDLMIYKIGEYGHIDIFLEGNATSFKSFSQNYPIGSVCKIVKHDYKNVVGWLRPKAKPQENILMKLLAENGIDTEGELREVIGHHAEYPVIINDKTNMSKEITQLKEQIRLKDSTLDECNKDVNSLKVQVGELRKQYDDFLNRLIAKLNPLGAGSDEATVMGEIDRLISTEDGSDDTKKKLEEAYKTIDELKLKLEDRKEIVNYKALPTFNQILKLLLLKSVGR